MLKWKKTESEKRRRRRKKKKERNVKVKKETGKELTIGEGGVMRRIIKRKEKKKR